MIAARQPNPTTITEKLLLAAGGVVAPGQPFLMADLVIVAWQRYPDAFGLPGFSDAYPHSNRVISELAGKRGLVRCGWLERRGPNIFAMTHEGRQQIARINGLLPLPPRIKGSHGPFFRQMLASEAVRKFSEGQRDAVAFAEALAFWNIRFPGDIAPRFEIVDRILRELEAALEDGSTRQAARRTVAIGDVLNVANVNRWLQGRFAGRLDAMQSRERKRVMRQGQQQQGAK